MLSKPKFALLLDYATKAVSAASKAPIPDAEVVPIIVSEDFLLVPIMLTYRPAGSEKGCKPAAIL